jgi:hypothetical protein
MPHLRLITALLAVAAITAACSSTQNATSGGQSQGSQPSTGSQPSQAAASSGAGGGGGGSGANGSITYEITGDYEASGELPFLAGGISLWVESANGWVANFADPAGGGAVIALNTQEGQTISQGLTYGDGSVTVIAASDAGSGSDCTFTLDKNDPDGLKGSVDCSSALAVDNNNGSQKDVTFNAQWDAHP